VSLLAERAWVLEDNLNGFAQIAEERIAELQSGDRAVGELLFRP